MTAESACSALEQSLVLMGGCDTFTRGRTGTGFRGVTAAA